MHIIKSKNRLSDTLTVKSGVKTLTLTVDMDLAAAAQALRKAQQQLAEAQKVAIENRTQETAEAYGAALRGLICVVFGEKQTDSLIDFYEGQPQSLLDDIMPYIFRHIVPAVTKASRRRAAQLAKGRTQ